MVLDLVSVFIYWPKRSVLFCSWCYGFNVVDMFLNNSTLCLKKKVPTFKLSVTLSNLNRFSKVLTAAKRMKFATKPIRHLFSSH